MLNGTKQTTINFDGEERIEEDLYGLFHDVRHFKKSSTYFRYLKFIARFKKYSIFNISLVFAQKPTVGYFATVVHWEREFNRRVKNDARPLVMLQPKGPIMFAFDIEDTIGDDEAIPDQLLKPFKTTGELQEHDFQNLKLSLKNCYIKLVWETDALVRGGKITRITDPRNPNKPNITITLNKVHDTNTNFVTLIHEIAHLFLGHLGNYDYALWPSRSNLSKSSKEFEAESVAFVLAGRLNLKTLSNQYLAGYMVDNEHIPSIDIRQIGKSVEWIEQMINGSTPKIFRTKKRGTA